MFASPNSNVCNSDFGPRAGTWVNFTELNENSDSFKDPKGCDYNYVYGVGTASWTTITWESTQITEQLFQVYTWKENASSGTTISAGRTLTSWDLILN
jgi:hypothetical protein